MNRPSRHPSEVPILLATLLLVGGVLVVTTGLTVCVVPLLIAMMAAYSYMVNQQHHSELMQQAIPVPIEAPSGENPALDMIGRLVRECRETLGCESVDVFIVPSRELNAYTFGLGSPKTIVLYQPMLKVMDADELKFVIGHEMGHVVFGHTWLNTLIGGMAGMPSSFGAAIIFIFAFRWWNRACEYSADRAGLAACGSSTKAVSALAQLAVGDFNTAEELRRALAVIEKQDDSLESIIGETLSDHPIIARRIKALQEYSRA